MLPLLYTMRTAEEEGDPNHPGPEGEVHTDGSVGSRAWWGHEQLQCYVRGSWQGCLRASVSPSVPGAKSYQEAVLVGACSFAAGAVPGTRGQHGTGSLAHMLPPCLAKGAEIWVLKASVLHLGLLVKPGAPVPGSRSLLVLHL